MHYKQQSCKNHSEFMTGWEGVKGEVINVFAQFTRGQMHYI